MISLHDGAAATVKASSERETQNLTRKRFIPNLTDGSNSAKTMLQTTRDGP